jgi:inhibitor of cysteine peptidase
MLQKISLSLFFLILLATMAGCNSSSPESNEPGNQQLLPIVSGKTANLQLDASADGSNQAMNVGEIMSFALESNPSTGFGWYATSSDPGVLVQLGEPEYQDPQSSTGTPLIGAPGIQTLYFQALSAGNATLTLEYKRSWETDVAPEKTITLTVEVK